jgi:hypothetical protein
MKTCRLALVLGLAGALLATSAFAGGTVKSGPQVDQQVPGPFHPLNVTGANAGEKYCLSCANGEHPVAMIFARELTPEVKNLIRKVDQATAKHQAAEMGSFVVFLGQREGLEKELKTFADQAGLKHIVLAIDNPSGPQRYKVAQDADVTVVLYTQHTVKANHAFKKGELKDDDVNSIIQDVSKIVQ